MKSNSEIKAAAKVAMSGNWGILALVLIIHSVIMYFAGNFPLVGHLFVGGPLALGLSMIAFETVNGEKVNLETLFKGFNHFGDAVKAQLIILLWSFLGIIIAPFTLFIPFFVWMLAYSMTFYILADNPGMDGFEAARKSKELMKGNKRRLLYFLLQYILWILMGIVTCFIGFLFTMPYIYAGMANFYKEIKEESGMTFESVDPDVLDADLA